MTLAKCFVARIHPSLSLLPVLLSCACLLAIAGGCTGNSAPAPAANGASAGMLSGPGLPAAGVPDLPLAFPRRAAELTEHDLFEPLRGGADFAADLSFGNVAPNGSGATLTPLAGRSLADTAFCVYRLRCFRDATTAELKFSWADPAPAEGTCWIGLPDWATQTWTWITLPAGGVLPVDPLLFASAEHTSYVAVVLTGESAAQLDSVACVCTPDGVEGFNLFSPYLGNVTYLTNMEGEVVHTWTADYGVKFSVYLLENDHLLRTNRNGLGQNGGKLEEVAWDGTVLWTFDDFPADMIPHHDIDPLPNGNLLAICYELVPPADMLELGMNPFYVPDVNSKVDMVVEIMPTGPDTGEIVWEWRQTDHFIQDYDISKPNYGEVGMNPQLLNINFAGNTKVDLVHANAVNYNAALDQIALSFRVTDEIYIIDHSTTTAEAASHSGGAHNKGGDYLYRWGNPQIYEQGSPEIQQLFGQHDVEWIRDGLPGAGNLLIYSNQHVDEVNGPYSTIIEITTPITPEGDYTKGKPPYGPEAPTWQYIADPPQSFYSSAVSSSQRLPDGNTLVCAGDPGWFFEVTPAGEIVWQYQNQFPSPEQPNTFRVDRYYLFAPWYDFNQVD